MNTTEVLKESLEGSKGKFKVVGEIAIDAAMKQIGDEGTISTSVGIGLIHGLIHGSVKRGVKAGLVILCMYTGVNVVKNVANNWDYIKKQ